MIFCNIDDAYKDFNKDNPRESNYSNNTKNDYLYWNNKGKKKECLTHRDCINAYFNPMSPEFSDAVNHINECEICKKEIANKQINKVDALNSEHQNGNNKNDNNGINNNGNNNNNNNNYGNNGNSNNNNNNNNNNYGNNGNNNNFTNPNGINNDDFELNTDNNTLSQSDFTNNINNNNGYNNFGFPNMNGINGHANNNYGYDYDFNYNDYNKNGNNNNNNNIPTFNNYKIKPSDNTMIAKTNAELINAYMESEKFEKKQLNNKMDNIIKYLLDIRTPTMPLTTNNYSQQLSFDYSFINIAIVVLIVLLLIDIILRAR